MKRWNFKLVMLAALSFTLTACPGKKDDDKSGKIRNQGHDETYEFEQNDCNTHKHDFNAGSAQELQNMVCEALQDSKRNNHCAEDLRRRYFEQRCVGRIWRPRHDQAFQPQPEPQPLNDERIEDALREYDDTAKIRNALRYVLVESYKIADDLNPKLTEVTEQLADEMRFCGLSYLGPLCHFRTVIVANMGTLAVNQTAEKYLFVDLRFRESNEQIALAFKIKETPHISSEDVTLFLKLKDKPAQQALSDYFADDNSVQPLATFKLITNNVEQIARQRLTKTTNLFELYHLSIMLYNLEGERGQSTVHSRNELAKNLEKHKERIALAESDFQYSIFELLQRLTSEKSILLAVAESLVKAQTDEIKQYAAVKILTLDKTRTSLKSLVIKAMDHPRSNVRQDAIRVLPTVELKVSEEIAIMLKLNDPDYYVRQTASEVTNGFDMKSSHISTLNTLMKSSYTSTRTYAATLMGRIQGHGANTILIDNMSDPDYYVRQEIYKQLKSKSVSNADLPAVKQQLGSTYTSTREIAATLLAEIGSEAAITLLINATSDNDYYVREAIFKNLKDQKVRETHLPNLAAQLGSRFTNVRSFAAKLVNKVSGDRATKLLISKLSDSDYYLRQEYLKLLEERPLHNQIVSDLTKELSSQYSNVRTKIAELLAKIGTPDARRALEARLSVEPDYYVKQAIQKAIESFG